MKKFIHRLNANRTPLSPLRKQLLISTSILLFLITGTTLATLYGKGYRLGFNNGKARLSKTGLLNASSLPKGAQVYVDGHLITATDNSVALTPGQYEVTISKDGYNPWKKNVLIKEQEVINADATLFPSAPSLQPISTFGVEDPVIDPSGTKLAFRIASQAARSKNGIYVMDMRGNNLPILAGQSTSTQIASDNFDDFSHATFSWSPDGEQILASVSGQLRAPTYYLLKATDLNTAPQDVTLTLSSLLDTWKALRAEKDTARLLSLKPKAQALVKQYFNIIAWSPDDTKILYQASASATLPLVIQPRRIGNNLLYERRDLQEGGVYVYNIQEDVNTRVLEKAPQLCLLTDTNCKVHPLSWFPDSSHLLYVNNNKIAVVEDDGSNMQTIYAGPFLDHYVFSWPDQSKIVILTNLNNESLQPTLYTISLK